MVTHDEVERVVTALPEVTVGTRFGNRTWLVGGKAFAWDRPFSRADVRRFGGAPMPADPIRAVRTADLDAKEAVLAEGRSGFFSIAHFDGYAAVLIELGAAAPEDVREAIDEAWRAVAPASVLGRHRPPAG